MLAFVDTKRVSAGYCEKIKEENKNSLIKRFITLNFKDDGIDKTNQTSH